jgi:SAM-dependent methyltransferase
MKKFEFPNPKNKNESFFFINQNFQSTKNTEEKYKILEYSENFDGWTEDHTFIHEIEIGTEHPIDVASRDICINLLKKYDNSEEKVILEIGCSSGSLINKIKELKNYKYIGSDAIRNSIKKLSKIYSDIPFLVFDLVKNPFNKSVCNSLIMLNVLEHIKDDDKALIEANKLLEKNGLLILEVPSVKFLFDQYDKELLHFRRYNMKDLIKKITNAGFKIEKKTHLGFIIFPLFIIIKFFNKFFRQKKIVTKQANFSNNAFIKLLFNIEKNFQNFSFPFGIRCFICARKN